MSKNYNLEILHEQMSMKVELTFGYDNFCYGNRPFAKVGHMMCFSRERTELVIGNV